ncbi:hypothetical protein OG713_02645 [Streptomyces sp. NBC_00723]|uniref:hypothetical protein n=1 Tax=Streptomyces sp. NBC_00723 TaxID=2903673 RepID=UPI003869E095
MKVERHLEAARPNLQPGDEEFICQIPAHAEDVPDDLEALTRRPRDLARPHVRLSSV